MSQTRTCPKCGAELPGAALEGLCPRCVARLAFDFGSPRTRLPYFGDYELLEEIARGGMGVVYRARQLSLNRVVAVKMILFGQFASRDFVQRFRTESEAAANLHHPNIVAIHEVGEHEGQHYFSMDYVEGRNLAELVRENPLPAARAAKYVQAIAEAIQYAHRQGVLHRDLKPSNVLIDAADRPQITDFGLAKLLSDESDLTVTGQLLGSPNYMPPEQAAMKREQIGPPSDVYSLGAILYHLLTGRPPFVGETLHDVVLQVLNHEPVALRVLNPGVPRDLDTVCLKCLEKDPPRRYQSAQELADELGRLLRDEPIRARPVGPAEKLWRWSRRNTKVAGLAGSLTLVFALGLSGVIWQWRRAEHNASEELRQRQRTEATLERMEIQRAEDFFTADNSAAGVAHLARVLRQHPANQVVAERLLSALTQRSFALPVTAPLQHDDRVRSARFSPDGQRVVTASDDKTARVWDAHTGQPLTGPLKHDAAVLFAEFSPDGQRVVTASDDKTARVWDARTGQPVTQPLKHHDPVFSAQFSADGQRVLTVSSNMARVWDTRTGQPLIEPLRHDDNIDSAQFSPDGQQVLTASDDRTARVWNARTGRPLLQPMKHDAKVYSAQFSPDGQRVVTASLDKTARVWDARTGQPLSEPLQHYELVTSAKFSPDGRRIVTCSDDNTARVWDARTGRLVTEPLKHDSAVVFAQFSPDGERILAVSTYGNIRGEISKSCGRRGVEKRHPEGDKKTCCHHTMAAQPSGHLWN
ncbi:MAG: serine/threonine protein kinase, partial [Verrucomicrobia bacterium]|nr:serine/threonine protein kinase [Verrucomicrobiota bacterium]